ncbi:MAG: hypothetical protein KA087_01535 [Candidatus Saccharicenans sp.]|nr:hypothetical protein [Candidatus Saccharicenans sp.]
MASTAGQKPETRLHSFIFFLVLTVGVVLIGIACRTVSPVVLPPGEILSFRGQGSFYFQSPGAKGRVRLNFFFELPSRARLEILNPLGGLESILWLDGRQATLYLTADRLFWQGETGFLLSQFLGGELAVEDLSYLLTGQVARLQGTWQINSEGSGQTVSGRKEDLSFKFKEYFAGSQIPKTILFEAESYSARLGLQAIKFNLTYKAELFQPSFPAGAREVSWEELSRLWKK